MIAGEGGPFYTIDNTHLLSSVLVVKRNRSLCFELRFTSSCFLIDNNMEKIPDEKKFFKDLNDFYVEIKIFIIHRRLDTFCLKMLIKLGVNI